MPHIKFGSTAMSSEPPDGLPRYRLLTGMDDAAFCHRVSEALALGYQLYGSPAATFNGRVQGTTVAPTLPGFRLSLQDIERPDQRYTPGRLARDNEVTRCGVTPAWPRVLTCPNGQTIVAQAPRE
jgi:hypothetical protein